MVTARASTRELRTVVRAPGGELDLSAVPLLRTRLSAAHSPGATVALDLSDVTFMDSCALSVVLSAERALRAAGGVLRLVQVADEVLRVLRICGLADRLVGRPGRLLLLPALDVRDSRSHDLVRW